MELQGGCKVASPTALNSSTLLAMQPACVALTRRRVNAPKSGHNEMRPDHPLVRLGGCSPRAAQFQLLLDSSTHRATQTVLFLDHGGCSAILLLSLHPPWFERNTTWRSLDWVIICSLPVMALQYAAAGLGSSDLDPRCFSSSSCIIEGGVSLHVS